MFGKGSITKILHEGQKVYAVVTEINGPAITVKFFFAGQVLETTVDKANTRKPHMPQSAELASFIRQMVGVKAEKDPDVKPTQTIGAGSDLNDLDDDEPTDPEDEE